ncbi:MAG: SDR family oxidoreductase [Pirellulaceae bacterium]|nr:SDR family oxidoreductase [Pirellulaceae bacterium]
MDLQLDGDVALVVGAASGIGRAIADEFAGQGCRVAAVDVRPAVHESARTLRAKSPEDVYSIEADATDYAAVQRVIDQVLRRWGGCTHAVYAAGAGSGKYGFPFWNLEPADWDRVWRVNLLGAVHVTHAVVPHWIEARRGTLLLLSSIAGQIGSQTDPPYSAAKAAVINFAQCAAKDLAAYDVRVNTICPGMIRTELNRSVWEAWSERQPAERRQSYQQWAEEKIRRVTPLGRWQDPEDVAALAVFLASPRARNITGQTLNVDGGQVMHW